MSINRADDKQPMIAPTEMVLSQEEREEQQPALASATRSSPSVEAELSKLRTQNALLEALTGVQVCTDGDAWTCAIFADPRISAEHWRVKHQGAPEPSDTGILRYRISAPGETGLGDGTKLLSYDGPATASDPELVARLPEHFRHQMNVKIDNAFLFQQRIADSIRQQ